MNVISNYQKIIEDELNKLRFSRDPHRLYDPIRYVLRIGGKRIRPALCMAFCHFFAGKGDDALSAALGLEVFHNFTLLHDDIMDNAPIRRNVATVHEKWDANTAILSGDAMMIVASKMMLNVPGSCLVQVHKSFLQTGLEVCEGQQYDMDFEASQNVTPDDYLEMIRLKTAVLIACSMKIGAIIGGASEKDIQLAYDFGQNLGLAFQLQDDYLDVFGNENDFGKNIGGDIVANKKTFMLISCAEKANESQKNELLYWLNKESFARDEKVASVKSLYEQTGVHILCRNKMERYYQMAVDQVDRLDIDKSYKQELAVFAEKLINRER
ncbi:MAG: polyprenyl synthetase family protein [Breznakibacter sp.]